MTESETPQKMQLSRMSLFLILTVLLTLPFSIVTEYIGLTDLSAMDSFAAYTSAAMEAVALAVLVVLILKIWDTDFRSTAIIIAIGFGMRVLADWAWAFSDQPDVSYMDILWLGGFVVWIIPTIPYIKKYGRLLRRSPTVLYLSAFALVAAAIAIVMTIDISNLGQENGETSLAVLVYVLYPILTMALLTFMFAMALLYAKGLTDQYWVYFIIAIGLLAIGDSVFSYYDWYAGGDWAYHLPNHLWAAAAGAQIAAVIVILRSKRSTIPVMLISEENQALKGILAKQRPLELSPGRSYVMASTNLDSSVSVVWSGMASGKSPLIVTTIHPSVFRQRYEIGNVPILWLSDIDWSSENPFERNVSLTELNVLANSLVDFLQNKNSVVMVLNPESIEDKKHWKDIEHAMIEVKIAAAKTSNNMVVLISSQNKMNTLEAFPNLRLPELRISK